MRTVVGKGSAMPDPSIDWRNRLVTVLGGGGFVGRYVCEALFKTGARVRVAQRRPRRAYFLQPMAAVGQLDLIPVDFNRPETLDAAVDGAWGVINLVGAFAGDLGRVHATSPRHLAARAAASGATSFVHVSAIGADPAAPSVYGQTKGAGEAAVREAFPNATIIRPSLVFGAEDQLTNRFAGLAARLPFLPVLGSRTRFQPIYVRDVARAIVLAATAPEQFGGRTFELGGPEVMTMHELNAAIAQAAGLTPDIIDLPDIAGEMISKLGFLPGAPLTRDQWLMLKRDNVVGEGAEGISAFGITPTPLSAVASDWLSGYQTGGRFARAHRHSQTTAG
jgi:NADH dehydrogenase